MNSAGLGKEIHYVADRVNCVGKTDFRYLSIKETNPPLDPRWESFVMQHPEASVYHHPAWLSALEQEYRQQCVHLICEDSSGKLYGIFPLMYTRGLPFGRKRPLWCASSIAPPHAPWRTTDGRCARRSPVTPRGSPASVKQAVRSSADQDTRSGTERARRRSS